MSRSILEAESLGGDKGQEKELTILSELFSLFQRRNVTNNVGSPEGLCGSACDPQFTLQKAEQKCYLHTYSHLGLGCMRVCVYNPPVPWMVENNSN